MFTAGVLQRDATGMVRVTSTLNPADFNGGTPIASSGELAVRATAPVAWVGGLGYDALGNLCIASEGTPTGYVSGLAVNNGAVCVSSSGTVAAYAGGLPVDAQGRLCVTGLMPGALFALGEPGAHYEAYDPTKLAVRRNLLTYSDNPGNAAWPAGGNATGQDNVTVAPDGTNTAGVIVEDSTSNLHRRFMPNTSFTAGQVYLISAYVKKRERHTAMGIPSANFVGANVPSFNLDTGTVSVAASGTAFGAGIEPATNTFPGATAGWYRIWFSATCSASGSNTPSVFLLNNPAVSAPSNSYQGDGVSGLYVWRAQFELGTADNRPSAPQKVTDWNTEYLAAAGPSIGMWQDSAGTTPVTAVEQPVGMWMDTKLGLVRGANTTINGGFDSNLASWAVGNATGVSTAGWAVLTAAGSGNASLTQNLIAGLTGKWVEATASFRNRTGGASAKLTIWNNSVDVAQQTSTATSGDLHVVAFLPAGPSYSVVALQVGAVAGNTCEWDNVAVREILGAGNHATQATAGSRPVLSARYNLLTKTEVFSDSTAWTVNAVTKTPSADGTTVTAAFTASTTAELSQPLTANATATGYVLRAEAKSATGKKFRLKMWNGTAVLTSPDFTPSVDWQVFTWTAPSSALSGAPNFSFYNDAAGTAGSVDFRKPDLRLANDAALAQPAYQRVNTATDYDTAGFIHYLRFDGNVSGLQTGNVDFSAVDKVTVWAGFTKLQDAASACVAETSANSSTTAGTYGVISPVVGSADHQFRSTGGNAVASAANVPVGQYPAPTSGVLTGLGDINAPSVIVRVNGAQKAINTVTAQGGGNYTAQILYIGRRGGTTLPFMGRITSLTVRGSTTPTPAAAIASMEQYAARLAGLTFTSQ